jgi:hypothetical protein
MRGLIFPAIILTQLSISCSENVNCIEPAAHYSYTFVPEATDSTACLNTSPATESDHLKCQYGGKVVVIGQSRKSKELMTQDEANKHAIEIGHPLTTGSGHDEHARRMSVTEQAAVLEAIPAHMKPNWQFYKPDNVNFGPNGCGIWATTVCNRILGLKSGPLTQTEWDETYADLGSFYGITFFKYISSYYQKKGFCSETAELPGYSEDYARIKDSLSKGCDVKLFFARKSSYWFLPNSNPHIETVVDVVIPDDNITRPYMHTNSWGAYAKVAGGSCTEFEHEKNHDFGKTHKEDKENFAWPSHDARVWVQTTCDCVNMPNIDELLSM